MSARLLILTAGYGEGHNAAARALAAAADEMHGPGAARILDVFSAARPRLNAVTRRAYLSLINRAPGAWRLAYGWLDRSPGSARFIHWLNRERRVLAEVIAQDRPDVMCSTYPLYAFMLAAQRMRDGGAPSPPHYNVVTDSISINSLWWRAPCAGWFVPNADSAAVVRAGGVEPAQIQALGFPVALFFANQQGRLVPPPLRAGTRPRILFIVNSGTRGAAEIARRLFAVDDWDITCAVGRDEAVRTQLMRAASTRRRPTPVLGWTNEIPRLLMTHHVVISKAGGATTQEAIAAHCPMIVNQIVPGQEEGNYELLRRHGIGALATAPDAIVAALRDGFTDAGRKWYRWHAALHQLARPNAARDIVRAILPAASNAQPVLAGFSKSASAPAANLP